MAPFLPPGNQSVRVDFPLPQLAHIVMDQVGKSANVLSREFQDELERALDEVERHPDLRGLVLCSAKPKIFVAGADLNSIVDHLDWDDEVILRFCEHGRRLYHRFQQGPWNSVAAIRGACVGGGLELALGCDWRVAADDRKTLLGLPETKLGLIPGWAGTVRLPRMMDLETAIDLITASRLFGAQRGLELGLVDRLAPDPELLAIANQMALSEDLHAERLARRQSQLGIARTIVADPDRECRIWTERVRKEKPIHPFAAGVLAEHMIRSAPMEFEAACESEARTMAIVWGSEPSHGLLNHFFLTEHNRRAPGFLSGTNPPASIEQVGVAGCGVMGRAIAGLLANAGVPVIAFDADPARAAALAASHPGKVTAAEGPAGMTGCSLVIEAVPEEAELKRGLLQSLAQAVSPATLIATNTSTFAVAALADAVEHPQRFCAIHFCHPQLLDLVEVVGGPATEPAVLQTVNQWLRGIGKATVVLRDGPGFVVNRLLMAMVDGALSWLPEGADWEQIDAAMEQFGMMGGPFRMIDEIGIDVLVAGGVSLARAGAGSQRRTVPVLPRLIRHGRLGRKSGAGFYRYAGPESQGEPDSATTTLLADCLGPARPIAPAAICDRILTCVLVAACELVDRGLAADRRDIDFCLIRGLGFPTAAGGILFWADQTGSDRLRALLPDAGYPTGSPLPESLQHWLRSGEYFYPHGNRTSSRRDRSG